MNLAIAFFLGHRGIILIFTLVTITIAISPVYSLGPERSRDKYGLSAGQDPLQLPDLLERLQALDPKGTFIVVDTALNRLYLHKNGQIVREAVCSTGSRRKLLAGGREWTFETPQGEFEIKTKTFFPAWKKPDWAYLEEGEPIPEDPGRRIEYGVLGQLALGFGEGFFIHGTLYTRLLGVNVTHGCIRLGDQDLEFLAQNVPVGTRIFIF